MAAPNSPDALMRLCLSRAAQSPPRPTNYCVGALLYSTTQQEILSMGHTLELEGNTHAEQCALAKYAAQQGVPEERVGEVLAQNLGVELYCSMEPCVERLSGNISCVERIVRTRAISGCGIQKVWCAIQEPETFVKENNARERLREAGIEMEVVEGFEEEARKIATRGHVKESGQD